MGPLTQFWIPPCRLRVHCDAGREARRSTGPPDAKSAANELINVLVQIGMLAYLCISRINAVTLVIDMFFRLSSPESEHVSKVNSCTKLSMYERTRLHVY